MRRLKGMAVTLGLVVGVLAMSVSWAGINDTGVPEAHPTGNEVGSAYPTPHTNDSIIGTNGTNGTIWTQGSNDIVSLERQTDGSAGSTWTDPGSAPANGMAFNACWQIKCPIVDPTGCDCRSPMTGIGAAENAERMLQAASDAQGVPGDGRWRTSASGEMTIAQGRNGHSAEPSKSIDTDA